VRHLAPGAARTAMVEGVEIQTYTRRPGWAGRLLNLPALAWRAAGSGAAVLHASEPDAWVAALLAGCWSGARVVIDVHEHYPSRLDAKLPRWVRPVARAALRLFCRLLGNAADAVVVAKDGLDADFAAPGRTVAVRNYALPAAVEPRQHCDEGPLRLAHAGALGRARGWPQMLEALALCPPGTTLRLIGRFTDGSEAEFSARASALGVADRIERLPWLPHAEAMARLAECDVGLVLFQPGEENHRLALPHKLFDCMLAGLPVVAPVFAEEVATVVREAGCGVLVDSADPGAVASAVAALGDPERRAEMGEAGRHAALGRFGWAGEAERLVALYDKLAPGDEAWAVTAANSSIGQPQAACSGPCADEPKALDRFPLHEAGKPARLPPL
ncbi:MAG: glycosyltransferase family 4 protein, partial [Acetobacteraceae bacterium]|nr:glycosyltransferase family 4 protein [Acetobacteraceae bacterium]